jgi:hypothetical protein
VRVDEFVLERFEGLVIQLELELEDTIGYTAALAQQVQDLIQHVIKVHRRPLLELRKMQRVLRGYDTPEATQMKRRNIIIG